MNDPDESTERGATRGRPRVTLAEFVDRAREIHGDVYDYSAVDLQGMGKRVTIGCRVHGPFDQVAAGHLQGYGCSQCGVNRSRPRVTLAEFVERACKIHGDVYDYSAVDLQGMRSRVTIGCRVHGPFDQSPAGHVQGHGCPQCGTTHNHRRVTLADFIERAREVHGDRFDYSRSVYTNSNSKIEILCRAHGPFWQLAGNHLRGQGCAQCHIERSTVTVDTFLEGASAMHMGRYDYSQTRYVGMNCTIDIICPTHGLFTQYARNHLHGSGCPDCSRDHLSRTRRSTTEGFVEAARRVHGDTYDYSRSAYAGSKTPVEIICHKHGSFHQTPEVHVRAGCGCPSCSVEGRASRPQRRIRSTKGFIAAARGVHGDQFRYDRTYFTHLTKPVTVTCITHGDFTMKAYLHLNAKGGICASCTRDHQVSDARANFIDKARAIHGDRYDYANVDYVNSRTAVTIVCPDHGQFTRLPGSHLHQSAGCPTCRKIGEDLVPRPGRRSIAPDLEQPTDHFGDPAVPTTAKLRNGPRSRRTKLASTPASLTISLPSLSAFGAAGELPTKSSRGQHADA